MVLENPILPFSEWLGQNTPVFLVTMLAVSLLGLLLGYLAAAMRLGPVEGMRILGLTLANSVKDLIQTSPRRVYAIARLAFQESIRRRVLVVFGVFLIALMFAGWFLDPSSKHPARLYLSFVLTCTNYLVLILAVFLSAFSLPNDIKNKTIYTIVTKPVRASEIVLGRILGFAAIGTILIVMMCLVSFFFVKRGLRHEHFVNPQALAVESIEDEGQSRTEQRGESSLARKHRHDVVIREDGVAVAATHDHSHDVLSKPDETPNGDYQLGPARGLFLARVPVYGSLRFLDAAGRPGKGVNVGYENKYRQYIEGGTLSAAIWRFEGLKAADFEKGLPLEMTLRVFRTYKGDIEKGIMGTIQLVKPAPLDANGVPVAADGGLRSVELSFTALDYTVYQKFIPREIEARDIQGNEVTADIFDDLVDPTDGSLEVWVRCLDRAQYLGMAPADLYLRAANRPFWLNFSKGYASIWFQMVVVTCLGVTFSTFLSGPVAMMATVAAVLTGFFKSFVFRVVSGDLPGGGPLESMVRLVDQSGQMTELDPGWGTWTLQRIDDLLMSVIQAVSYAMPNCGAFDTGQFVAYGFNIPGALIAQHLTITLVYALVVSIIGYFCFKTREIAA